MNADEVIVTSSSNLCLRADMIDGKPVGGGDSTLYNRLREYLFEEFYTAISIFSPLRPTCAPPAASLDSG